MKQLNCLRSPSEKTKIRHKHEATHDEITRINEVLPCTFSFSTLWGEEEGSIEHIAFSWEAQIKIHGCTYPFFLEEETRTHLFQMLCLDRHPWFARKHENVR